jgi:uncharacterized protein (DUF924 family)
MIETILAFWFGPVAGVSREAWFRKDEAFDEEIRTRFGEAIATTLGGGYSEWMGLPRGCLARVLLLDQFTRNAYRGTARAFAGDAEALANTEHAIGRGYDRALAPVERWFLYMPFEHSERAAVQARSLELFSRLAEETGLDEPLPWARRHAAVIARFGRYPHRNAILGRTSTPEEIAFLQEPGSRF